MPKTIETQCRKCNFTTFFPLRSRTNKVNYVSTLMTQTFQIISFRLSGLFWWKTFHFGAYSIFYFHSHFDYAVIRIVGEPAKKNRFLFKLNEKNVGWGLVWSRQQFQCQENNRLKLLTYKYLFISSLWLAWNNEKKKCKNLRNG